VKLCRLVPLIPLMLLAACSSNEPTNQELQDFAKDNFSKVIVPPFSGTEPSFEYVGIKVLGDPIKKDAKPNVDLEDALYVTYSVDLLLKTKKDCEYHAEYFRDNGSRLISYCLDKNQADPRSPASDQNHKVLKAGEEITEHNYRIVARLDRSVSPKRWDFMIRKH
jgi:hypothetical protein